MTLYFSCAWFCAYKIFSIKLLISYWSIYAYIYHAQQSYQLVRMRWLTKSLWNWSTALSHTSLHVAWVLYLCSWPVTPLTVLVYFLLKSETGCSIYLFVFKASNIYIHVVGLVCMSKYFTDYSALCIVSQKPDTTNTIQWTHFLFHFISLIVCVCVWVRGKKLQFNKAKISVHVS